MKKGTGLVEPEEEVYVNLEELVHTGRRKDHQRPETGTKPVGTGAAVEGGATQARPAFRDATVGLGLLCVLLFISVVTVAALYDRDVNQLFRDLTNSTAERNQLLARYQNLTDDRNQLESSFKETELLLNKMRKIVGTCSDGWSMFGCSCYLLSTSKGTWEASRRRCLNQGADLVAADSREEMLFLNSLGAHLKFWIGLKQAAGAQSWKWTDGRSPVATYWKTSWYNPTYRSEICAAFSSFQTAFFSSFKSWSRESCSSYLQWVCEKKSSFSCTQ
ncbi:C-type lectin domain family 12 member B-like [Cololabis saira]|uniref:C-type lectin domain family 12 member B-like n=1 Tax=Cololabis saira TaxID=129043 RepID=UPI002AD48A0F|nr:C-type lectin domain family 12 member B-like [Cololabis saira]